MAIRILFSLILLVVSAGGLSGQSNFRPWFVLRGDYDFSRLDAFDINDFYRSYNAYYAWAITQPFDTLSATAFSHSNFGGGFRVEAGEKVGFTTGLLFTYGVKRLQQEARFANDIRTETAFRVRDFNLKFEMGLHFWETVYLQAHLTGRFRKVVMDLGYYYQDGSYSLGDEYDILGVYKGLTTNMDVGGSIGLRLWRFYIPVTISYPMNWFSDDGLLTLADFDPRQIRWEDLPRDFATWADDPANIDLDTGFVRMQSFRAMRINVGLEFWF